MGIESLVGWDLLTQSGNMAKDCDATASYLPSSTVVTTDIR